MPYKDQKKLLGMMQGLFAYDSFAYTAMGTKPLSWATYRSILPFTNLSSFRDSLSKYNRTMRAGWKIWKKYSHQFPETVLFMEKSGNYSSILMTNPQAFNTVVNENKSDFEKVLNRKINDGYELLEEAKAKPLTQEVLKRHQALIGIVLGYGRENSWHFHEKARFRIPTQCIWAEKYPGDIETIESTADLNEILLRVFSCPSFSGDPDSEESKLLKSQYLEMRKAVLEYYKGKDFLEASLSLLAGYQETGEPKMLNSNYINPSYQ